MISLVLKDKTDRASLLTLKTLNKNLKSTIINTVLGK